MKKDLTFVDAQQMHKENPKTFEVPSKKELDEIKKESYVKVCANNAERFWTKVIGVDGEKITALVNNDLVCTNEHGLRCNDLIEFEKKNVYSIEQ